MNLLLRLLKQQWFVALLLAAVGLGMAYPSPGIWLHKNLGTKPFVFALLFMTSLTLDLSELVAGFRAPKPILLSLCGTYLILPVLLYAAGRVLGLDSPLGLGLVVMAAAPTTMASAAIWTRLSGGNTALCVAMVVVSNGLNAFLGPLVLQVTLGQTLAWPMEKIVLDLLLVVLLPIVLAQGVARFCKGKLAGLTTPIGVVSRLTLIGVIIQAASRAAEEAGKGLSQSSSAGGPGVLEVAGVAWLVALCILAHGLAVVAMDLLSRLLSLSRADRIACIYVGGQKTLPVAVHLLGAFPATMALGVLPIVTYHAIQLLFDSILIELFRRDPRSLASAAATPPDCLQPQASGSPPTTG